MANQAESDDRNFWNREALLTQRENALFVIQEELKEREEILLEKELVLAAKDEEYRRRESDLISREITLWETEAWLDARTRVLNAAHDKASVQDLKALQAAACDQVYKEYSARDAELKTAQETIKEREAFIQNSENTISEKGRQLLEWEAELAQLHDELKRATKI